MQFLFQQDGIAWKLLREDPDRYIYEPFLKGVNLQLPKDIEAGINDVSKRNGWNKPATEKYALPTETWREHVTRRQRCLELRQKIADGEINSANDLITYNLNMRQLAQDVIENCYDPELVWAFYQAITKITVLDPTCGSGAFLFSALNILEPLYEACLEQMQIFLDEGFVPTNKNAVQVLDNFRNVLEQVGLHPNRQYFILKTIIINNLYGVDIMQEATEICKLRLYLKLASQIEPDSSKTNNGIEPLPDIDFNIRAGNTLVGFTSIDELQNAIAKESSGQMKLVYDNSIVENIQYKAQKVDDNFQEFRRLQISTKNNSSALNQIKLKLNVNLRELREELDKYLANEYEIGLSQKSIDFNNWKNKYQPFHWFVEFYTILSNGGFDVIIGNPPYVEYRKVRQQYHIKNYQIESCGNLYAYVIERCLELSNKKSLVGFIIPMSAFATERMIELAQLMQSNSNVLWISNYGVRPSKLFDGVNWRLAIAISTGNNQNQKNPKCCSKLFSTKHIRWYSEEREVLFSNIQYCEIIQNQLFKLVPKYSHIETNTILQKLLGLSGKIINNVMTVRNKSPHFVHYQEATQYWIKAMNRLPFYEKNGIQLPPAHARFLYFQNEEQANLMCFIMNSSIFYIYFNILSDCYHLSDALVRSFPIPKSLHSEVRVNSIAKKLMDDLEVRATIEQIRTSGGDNIKYASLTYTTSKAIIDEIDRVLAQHYGFTDEELDFIINYDIKYRMGKDSKDED